MTRELGDVLRQVRLLYGVAPEDTIEKYNDFQLDVLKEMAKEDGYKAKFFSPELHERTIDKVYNFYEEKFD